jgi:hypothetical protein
MSQFSNFSEKNTATILKNSKGSKETLQTCNKNELEYFTLLQLCVMLQIIIIVMGDKLY